MVNVNAVTACFRCHDINYTNIYIIVKKNLFFIEWFYNMSHHIIVSVVNLSETEVEIEIQEFPYKNGQRYRQDDPPETEHCTAKNQNDHDDNGMEFG